MDDQEKENVVNRVFSSDRRTFFNIIKGSDHSFFLQKYITCYDNEEGVNYVVRQEPDPTGRYESIETAIDEAKRILS